MIGKLLGDSEIETTACYVRLARDTLHELAERIAVSIAAEKGNRGYLTLWVKEESQSSMGGQDWPDARSG